MKRNEEERAFNKLNRKRRIALESGLDNAYEVLDNTGKKAVALNRDRYDSRENAAFGSSFGLALIGVAGSEVYQKGLSDLFSNDHLLAYGVAGLGVLGLIWASGCLVDSYRKTKAIEKELKFYSE